MVGCCYLEAVLGPGPESGHVVPHAGVLGVRDEGGAALLLRGGGAAPGQVVAQHHAAPLAARQAPAHLQTVTILAFTSINHKQILILVLNTSFVNKHNIA